MSASKSRAKRRRLLAMLFDLVWQDGGMIVAAEAA
jgi:hypothetical protein